ncbi:flavodoxin family protein [Clostridium perfringens]|uniref:flavodoxin family protein n=1 Tax=Clostridium perfringens TaxID=1502 RepID=UPI0028E15CBA|nr:flavodoxin family protein [Clostridium perfringens]MDT9335041.1 flavodoxin family protein [Clostridium perfringens]MDT9342801.1 flavodoxin family protein [Clostridium perfringens]MDT9345981.1 flavodoxin family protein [Clostridium perfringens]MDT9351885.1 flavodoxin family protein [Clostridium perfringens]
MRLLLSDKELNINFLESDENKYIDLSKLRISNCIGCFGCWTKTPGKCVIRDDAVKVYPVIAKSDKVIYVSKVKYGSYDTVMKTMLERAIPIQQAFIRLLNGEAHHVQRNVAMKDAIIIAYGNIEDEEKEIFKRLVERNSHNMNFKSFNVIFVDEENLEEVVAKEVRKWEE